MKGQNFMLSIRLFIIIFYICLILIRWLIYFMQVTPNLTKTPHVPVYYSSVKDQKTVVTNPKQTHLSLQSNQNRQVIYQNPQELKTARYENVEPQYVTTKKTVVYEHPTKPLLTEHSENVRQFPNYQNQNQVKLEERFENPQAYQKTLYVENTGAFPSRERRFSQETENPQYMKLQSNQRSSKNQNQGKIKVTGKRQKKQDCCPFPLIIFLILLALVGLILGFLFGMGFFKGDMKNNPQQHRDKGGYFSQGEIINGAKYSPYSISVQKNVADKSGKALNSNIKTDRWGALTPGLIIKDGKNLKNDYSEILEESLKIPVTNVKTEFPIQVKDKDERNN